MLPFKAAFKEQSLNDICHSLRNRKLATWSIFMSQFLYIFLKGVSLRKHLSPQPARHLKNSEGWLMNKSFLKSNFGDSVIFSSGAKRMSHERLNIPCFLKC